MIRTNQWFEATALPLWEHHLPPRKPSRLLVVGSYEGAAEMWFARRFPGATICSIDNFKGSAEHEDVDMAQVRRNFHSNREEFHFVNWAVCDASSQEALPVLRLNGVEGFDVVYIDASHKTADVLTDAVNAWPLVRFGGLMIFDDYDWGENSSLYDTPKLGIDCFVDAFRDQLKVVDVRWQYIVEKKEKENAD